MNHQPQKLRYFRCKNCGARKACYKETAYCCVCNEYFGFYEIRLKGGQQEHDAKNLTEN